MRTLKNVHTSYAYSAEKIKVKMEEESRNNTFRDGILGLLTYALKMFLSENIPHIRNDNTNSQILYHLSHSLTLRQWERFIFFCTSREISHS
jgi:hypothetical protein